MLYQLSYASKLGQVLPGSNTNPLIPSCLTGTILKDTIVGVGVQFPIPNKRQHLTTGQDPFFILFGIVSLYENLHKADA